MALTDRARARLLTALLAGAVLAWFNAGLEPLRFASFDDLRADPARVLSPPWNLLRLVVSREGDDHLYYEYTRLVMGEPADLGYVARRHQQTAAELAPAIAAVPGWRLAYRDFPFEYPPLSLAAMMAPRLVADTLPGYRLAFGALMGALAVGALLLGADVARRLAPGHGDRAARRVAWLLLAIGPILVARFDVFPAFLAALALWLAATGRWLRAGLALGLGAMTKLFPGLLLLPWAAALLAQGRPGWRAAARLAAGTALAAGAVAAPFLVACPGPFARGVLLYGARPFQGESLVGGLMLLLRGAPAAVAGFGSDNAAAPALVTAAWSLVLPAALAGLAVLAFRAERAAPAGDAAGRLHRLCAFTAAALLAVLCASKVLSPQFQLWLLPAVALLPGARGRRVFALAVTAGVLTQTYYPYLYDAVVHAELWRLPLLLLLARNLALVACAVAAVAAARAAGGPAAALAGDQGAPAPQGVSSTSQRRGAPGSA